MIKIILKRDVLENWKTTNFIPRENELISIIDKHQIAIGDGITHFNNLRKFDVPEEFDKIALYYSNDTRKPEVILDCFGKD